MNDFSASGDTLCRRILSTGGSLGTGSGVNPVRKAMRDRVKGKNKLENGIWELKKKKSVCSL